MSGYEKNDALVWQRIFMRRVNRELWVEVANSSSEYIWTGRVVHYTHNLQFHGIYAVLCYDLLHLLQIQSDVS